MASFLLHSRRPTPCRAICPLSKGLVWGSLTTLPSAPSSRKAERLSKATRF